MYDNGHSLFFSEKLNVFRKSSLVISLQTLINPTDCFYCRKFTKSFKSPHISVIKFKNIFHHHIHLIPMYSNGMHIVSIAVLRALFLSFIKYFCSKNCFKLIGHIQQGVRAVQAGVIQSFRV